MIQDVIHWWPDPQYGKINKNVQICSVLVSIYNDSIIFFCTEIFYQRMYRLKIEHFQKFCHIVWSSFRAQGDCTKNGNIRINYVLRISLADPNVIVTRIKRMILRIAIQTCQF